MPCDRFFLDSPLSEPTFSLEKEEAYHLIKVMRAQLGDTIEVMNGKGTVIQAEVTSLNKNSAELRLLSRKNIPPSPSIILAQALLRPSLLDWVIEKGTELGALEFWLFPGERSEKKELSAHFQDRLKNLTIAALKQSGRVYLPKIVYRPPICNWTSPKGSFFYGDLSPLAPKFSAPLQFPLIVTIGPEKGFSEEEVINLRRLGAQPLKLQDYTLRAETASLAALSQIALLQQ